MRVFGLAGRSGSGRTELMLRLLPELTARGLRVSAVREAPDDFDIDKPGKDSYQHRAAGAAEVMLCSSHRFALMHEGGQRHEPRLGDIFGHMAGVDLVLVEGFRQEPHDKLEIHRGTGRDLLAAGDPTIVAVASDGPLPGLALPQLDLADSAGIAAFIMRQCGLQDLPRSGVADPALRLGQSSRD